MPPFVRCKFLRYDVLLEKIINSTDSRYNIMHQNIEFSYLVHIICMPFDVLHRLSDYLESIDEVI